MTTLRPISMYASGPYQDAAPTPSDDSEPGEVCIANISPRERRRRLNAGLVQLAIGVAILVVLLATGVDHWWRLPLFILFAGGAISVFQWRDKT